MKFLPVWVVVPEVHGPCLCDTGTRASVSVVEPNVASLMSRKWDCWVSVCVCEVTSCSCEFSASLPMSV